MKYVRLILILVLAIASVNVSAKKKKKVKVWPTDSTYITHRIATIMAMDSVLKNSGLNPDPLMRFADKKCEEFNNDPELMRAIASGFAFKAGYMKEAIMRYQEIKRLYPDDFESYSSYAATLFDGSITVKPDGSLSRDITQFNQAKAQIDSAKVAFPQSKAPYLWWLERCTRYAYNDSLVKYFHDEVEAYRKTFPNDNADFVAASYMSNAEMEMTKFDKLYDKERELEDYLRVDAEEYRRMETQKFFDKIDINSLPSDNLYAMTLFYYKTTESRFMGRDGRALLHEQGLECAKLGVQKFPDYANFSRFQLWHAAELAKAYDFRINQAKKNKDKELQTQETANRDTSATQGIIGAERLMSMTDTLLREDYYFAGVVNQFKGNYESAVDYYRQALEKGNLPYRAKYHNCDSITIYENIANCYEESKQYEKAIAQKQEYFDLRSKHGVSITISDVANLATLYRSIGNDTAKTQQERFAAYVAVDSLYALIQDSIDAGSENFPSNEGYTGYYPFQRYVIRNQSMNALSDYEERTNYLAEEVGQEVIRRVEPIANKSTREEYYISRVAWNFWVSNFNEKNYKECIPYQKLIAKYDPETAEKQKKRFEYARKHAR